jgi:hypothetical protein
MERAEAQWIADWLEKHPDRDEDSARSAWESLSVEIRLYLMTISEQASQNLEDIRRGLLATLNEYRGFTNVKKVFEDAIKSVQI